MSQPSPHALQRAIQSAMQARPNVRVGTARVGEDGRVDVGFGGGDGPGDLVVTGVPVVCVDARRRRRRGRIRDGQTVVVGYDQRDPQRPFILAAARMIGGPELAPYSPAILVLLDWARHGRDEGCARFAGSVTSTWSPEPLGVQSHTHPSAGGGPVATPRIVTSLVWFWQRRDGVWCLVAGHHDLSNPGSGPSYTVAAQLLTDPFDDQVGPVCLVLETEPNGDVAGPFHVYTAWVTGGENPLSQLPLEVYESWEEPAYLSKTLVTAEGWSHVWACELPGIPLGSSFLAHGYRWQVVGTWHAGDGVWDDLRVCKVNEATGEILGTSALPLGTPTVAWAQGAALDAGSWGMGSSPLPWALEGGQRGQDFERGFGRVRHGGYLRDFSVVREIAQDANSGTLLVPIWSYAEQLPVWRVGESGVTVAQANQGWTGTEYRVYTSVLTQAGRLLYHWEELRFGSVEAIILGTLLTHFTLWEKGTRSEGITATPTWGLLLYRVFTADLQILEDLFTATLDYLTDLPQDDRYEVVSSSRVPTHHVHGWDTQVLVGAATAASYTVPQKSSGISWRELPLTIELMVAPEVGPGEDPTEILASYKRELEPGESVVFEIEYVIVQEAEGDPGLWSFYHDTNSHFPTVNIPGTSIDYNVCVNGPFTGILRRRFRTIRITTQTGGDTFHESYTVPWSSCHAAANESGPVFAPRAYAGLWPSPDENPADEDPARPAARPFAFFDWTLALRSEHEDPAWEEQLDGTYDEETLTSTVFALDSISTPVLLGADQAFVAARGVLVVETEIPPENEEDPPTYDTTETEQLQLWTQRVGVDAEHATIDSPDIEGLGSTYADLMAVANVELGRALVVTGHDDKILSLVMGTEVP
ncbi:MAG: hypothetical protein AMXMBFR33_01370 [Candidatus Xenobia bacterium]